MAEKWKGRARIISQDEITPGIYDMHLVAGEIAARARAGQFVTLYCSDKSRLLPRPISICEVKDEEIRLVYRIAGAGTAEFSHLAAGDGIEVMGPLGNGFPIKQTAEQTEKYVSFLIGGGIGIPPMLQLAKELGGEKQIILGFRDENLFLTEDLARHGSVYIATEDGSIGTKGNVLDVIRENALEADAVYACGPAPMLRAIKQYAAQKGIPCWISMEERMACGIGACLACVCRTNETDAHTNVKNTRICREGPVFNAEEIDF